MIAFADEGLAERVKLDGSHFGRLLEANRGLVVAAAKRALGSKPWGRFGDEAIQGATVGLWIASIEWDEGGEPWGRFAFRIARRESLRYIRSELRGIPAEALGDGIKSTIETRSQGLGDWIDCPDAGLVEFLSTGSNHTQTAAALGMSRKRYRNALAKLRARAKA